MTKILNVSGTVINLLSYAGCSLIGPDGTEVNLDDLPPNSPLYIGLGEISDNEVPRVLYTCKTDGITSFDPGMKHYYKKEQH